MSNLKKIFKCGQIVDRKYFKLLQALKCQILRKLFEKHKAKKIANFEKKTIRNHNG